MAIQNRLPIPLARLRDVAAGMTSMAVTINRPTARRLKVTHQGQQDGKQVFRSSGGYPPGGGQIHIQADQHQAVEPAGHENKNQRSHQEKDNQLSVGQGQNRPIQVGLEIPGLLSDEEQRNPDGHQARKDDADNRIRGELRAPS